jgi:glycosyltransferase involved in cell wall biosynthesis
LTADAVITVHEPYRRELSARFGVPLDKIVVVMNAVDESLLPPVAKERETRRTDGAFVIGYTGTVNEWYGLDLVLDAAARLRPSVGDVRVMILGDGDAVEHLRDRARRLGLTNVVDIPGVWLPQDEALAKIARTNVGVIPNRPSELNRFALSTKLFEYVAVGVPVVAARLQTLRGHFTDEEVTYFEPGDVSALATALEWVATHHAEVHEKVRRARERVTREYSWAMHEARYIDVLNRS